MVAGRDAAGLRARRGARRRRHEGHLDHARGRRRADAADGDRRASTRGRRSRRTARRSPSRAGATATTRSTACAPTAPPRRASPPWARRRSRRIGRRCPRCRWSPGPPARTGTPATPPGAAAGVAPPIDRDGDGLSAGRERSLHTSDLDRDSDDDGLSDAREAPRGGPSPSRRDSDRDGLSDGVELGVRRPVADPPGRVRGTNRGRFHADADPRTRTDPARRDSDRDGTTDGREDRNHNGRVDRGESDPRRKRR